MIVEKLQQCYLDQAVQLHNSLVPFEANPETARKVYAAMADNDDYYFAAAREGDEILGILTGICCHGLGVNFLVLEDLVVKESLRGGGIGTALMDAVEAFGRRKNCAYVFLVSSGFRKRAHAIYEKRGYTEGVRGFRKPL